MSHISTCGTVFNDKDSIVKAGQALGLVLVEENLFKTYGGQKDRCDFRFDHPTRSDAYQVGFVKKEDGTYEMQYDSFGGGNGMMELIGENAGRFEGEYKLERTKKALRSRGVRFREERRQTKEGRWKRRLVASMR